MSLPARTSSQVVGAVYSEESLAAALRLASPPAAPDLLELRVDHFAGEPERLDELVARTPRGLIVTVRHAAEGGHGELDVAARAALYARFMPVARYVDLELGSLVELAPVVEQACQTAGGLIASCHDFHGTPALAVLRDLAGRAADAGAAICKLAVRVERPGDLRVLLELLETEKRVPLAVMGMGPLGRLSRLLAGALGSRLNYGYLGEAPQVPGQWPVAALRARLEELSTSE